MRNLIISIIIGLSVPYLPFWEWDGTGDIISAAGIFFFISLALLAVTGGNHEKGARFCE